MEEHEAGKRKFAELIQGIDPTVDVVIPTTPSNSMFLISLTKGASRKFLTVSEDDILDLPNESDVEASVTKLVKDAIASL